MTSEEPAFRSLARAERRSRIVWAAKRELLEKGLDAASMDDVALRAGTTKPTVYAHFRSKEELFGAVAELVKELFLGKLRGPEVYADEPVEAVTRFCARALELVSWGDCVGFQRVALSAAARSPALAGAVHDTLFAAPRRLLATYLRDHALGHDPDGDAELLLAATTGGGVVRHLYGVDTPSAEMPDDEGIGARIDLEPIHAAVRLIATRWNLPG